jgi:hypothetical protein
MCRSTNTETVVRQAVPQRAWWGFRAAANAGILSVVLACLTRLASVFQAAAFEIHLIIGGIGSRDVRDPRSKSDDARVYG